MIHLSLQAQVSPDKKKEKHGKALFSPNISQHHCWVRHCTIRRLAGERQQCCRASKSTQNRTKLFCFHRSPTFTRNQHPNRQASKPIRSTPQQNVKIIPFRTFPYPPFGWTKSELAAMAHSNHVEYIACSMKFETCCHRPSSKKHSETSGSLKIEFKYPPVSRRIKLWYKQCIPYMFCTQVKSNTVVTA